MGQDRLYSIGEVSKILGVPSSTLRFYDKKGLLPAVARTEGGIRRFTEADIDWLRIVEGMKMLGMSLAEISEMMSLQHQGNETIEDRSRLVRQRREEVLEQMEELQTRLDLLNWACWLLDTAAKEGNLEESLEMVEEKMPSEIKGIAKAVIALQAAKEQNKRPEKTASPDSK